MSNIYITDINPYNQTRRVERSYLDENNEKFEIFNQDHSLIINRDYKYRTWATISIKEDDYKFFTLYKLSRLGLQNLPVGEIELEKDLNDYLLLISTQKFSLTEEQLEETLWKIWYVYSINGTTRAQALAKGLLNFDPTEALLLIFADNTTTNRCQIIENHILKYNWDMPDLRNKAIAFEEKELQLAQIPVDEFVIPKYITRVISGIPQIVKKVILHDCITSIDEWALFKHQIDELIMPDSVNNICDNAFCQSNIKYLRLSNNIKYIGKAAFNHAYIPEELIFNDGLEEIQEQAFCDTNITKVVLPSSVKFIGWKAFGDCKNLKEVVMPEWFCTVLPGYGTWRTSVHVTRKDDFNHLKNIFGDNYKDIKFTFLPI